VGGAEIWSSHFYGPKTGRVVVPGHGPGTGLLTTGGSAILRFSPAGPISTVSPESGPAAGGTRITAEDPAVQAGAALYVGSDVTTAISSQNGEVSGDAPVLSPGTLHDVLVVNPDNSLLRSTDAWLVDYLDVPAGDSIHDFVSTISRARVTAGCGGGNFCPDSPVTRAQMAVFLLRGLEGKAFAPNEATGTRFDDVACGDFAAAWIEELSIRQVTAGCGPSSYCPQSGVLREQMAVFLLRTVEGPSYVPPPAQGDFADVPVSSVYAPWIEEIAHRGITAGCGGGNFCPTLVVTRGQMAVFLQSTFGL
jgi:hypothetical protein